MVTLHEVEIDPATVVELRAYFREWIFTARLADGMEWSMERDAFFQMLRALEEDSTTQVAGTPAGYADFFWTVTPRETAAGTPSMVVGDYSQPSNGWASRTKVQAR